MADEDFFDEIDDLNYAGGVEDVSLHDDYEMLTKVTDTSAAQARKGKDIQGIPYITRESYRLTRLEQYINFENILTSGEAVDKECKQVEKGGKYYEFFYNTRMVKPTILHFQDGMTGYDDMMQKGNIGIVGVYVQQNSSMRDVASFP